MPNRTSSPVSAHPAPTGSLTRHSLLTGPVPILAAAALWGTTGTASSLAPSAAPAAAVGAAGLTLGGLMMFLSTRSARRLPRRCTRQERRLLVAGAIAVAGYPLSFYPAVARCGVAVATVIALGSAPVFAGLLGWFSKGAKPTAWWLTATATAIAGCTVLVLGPEFAGATTPVDVAGVALAAVAGMAYAAYSLIGAELMAHGHASRAVMGAMFAAAAPLVVPVVLASNPRWLLTPAGAAVVMHLGLVTTFVAYWLFGYGLRHTTAQVATTLTLAEPAVAAVLGVALLNERLPLASWSGLAVLAVGLTLLTRNPGTRRTG